MNLAKKILNHCLVLCLVLFGTSAVKAADIADISAEYWAKSAIEDCVNRDFMSLNSAGKFQPDDTITRAEFVSILLKVIQSDDLKSGAKSNFKDVNSRAPHKDSIVTSQQLRIIYGYPDKTFKPNAPTKHTEAMSAVANVTKSFKEDVTVLDGFKDVDTIPSWAKNSYIQNVIKDLYVNHPDPDLFKPNADLTRAEAAVLFAKIADNLDLVRAKYRYVEKQKEYFIASQTLAQYSKAPRDVVNIYNTKKVIEAGNIVVIRPVVDISSKTVVIGDKITFTAPADVYTVEGIELYPEGTEFVATVRGTKNTVWTNKPDKALLIFDTVSYPDGIEAPMAGVIYTNDFGNIVYMNAKETKREIKEAKKELTKADFLIKHVKKLIPVTRYEIPQGQDLYLLFTGDLVIPQYSL